MSENRRIIMQTKDLTIRFGGLVAVNNFNMKIEEGELIGIIGPNGAGKTTIFNMITGVYVPTSGAVELEGKSIIGQHVSHITQKGIARTFQNIRLFKDLSVIDNIKLAAHYRTNYSLFDSIIRNKKFKNEEERIYNEAMEILKIFGLEKKSNLLAKNLPYGEQRRLEIARALATKPKLLLLDEPAAGMNPKETKDLTELIRWVRDHFKISILLIEHDMKLVMNVCERIYVVDHGEEIAMGLPKEIQNNKKVIEAYLGTSDEEAL